MKRFQSILAALLAVLVVGAVSPAALAQSPEDKESYKTLPESIEEIEAAEAEAAAAQAAGPEDRPSLPVTPLPRVEAVVSDFPNDMDRLQELTGLDTDDYRTNLAALEGMIRAGTTNARIAYLTFDDGPFALTEQYLAVLDHYNVRGTFFVLGKPDCTALYQKIIERGHTLANHTYGHQIYGGLYASSQAFLDDVLKQEAFLNTTLGVRTNIVRFPGGSPTAKELRPDIAELLRQQGYGYLDWTVMSGDVSAAKPSAEQCVENVLNGVKNQRISVVLMHDSTRSSLGALPELITGLRKEGFLLLPLVYESSMVKVAQPPVVTEPDATQAESGTSEAQPDAAQAQPDAAQAQPDAAQAQPDTAQAQPDSSEAQPDSSEAQPDTAQAQPDAAEAQSEDCAPSEAAS